MRFVCTIPCFHNGHRFKKGDIFSGKEELLPHTNGNLRHFAVLDGEPDAARMLHGPEVSVNGKKPEPEEITAAQDEAVCEKCGTYRGTVNQVRGHQITCRGKKE